jgi:hypothetical protein
MAATSQGKNQAPATATAEGPAMTAAGTVISSQDFPPFSVPGNYSAVVCSQPKNKNDKV